MGRLQWAVVLEDESFAYLPTMIGLHVERVICQHRRDRKVLADKKPNGWEKKLEKVNGAEMPIIFNKRTCDVFSDPKQLKRVGKHLEHLQVTMTLEHAEDISGPASYWISANNYPKRKLVCLSAKGKFSGLDALKDTYANESGASMTWDCGGSYENCSLLVEFLDLISLFFHGCSQWLMPSQS